MTDEQIINAVRSGTHVLIPATGDWEIHKIELPRADCHSVLSINIETGAAAAQAIADLFEAQRLQREQQQAA